MRTRRGLAFLLGVGSSFVKRLYFSLVSLFLSSIYLWTRLEGKSQCFHWFGLLCFGVVAGVEGLKGDDAGHEAPFNEARR